MKYVISSALAMLGISLCLSTAVAQTHDDSIEESWNTAAREKAAQQQRDEQYQWNAQQQASAPAQTKTPPPAQMHSWPYLPAHPGTADYYQANKLMIDSLTNLYCVSGTYMRTLSNRNEAAKPAAPATIAPIAPPSEPKAQKESDTFQYQKETWQEGSKQQKQQQQIAPPPVADSNTEVLRTLHEELQQLLDKCLNR